MFYFWYLNISPWGGIEKNKLQKRYSLHQSNELLILSSRREGYAFRIFPWQEVRPVWHTYDEAFATALSDLLAVDGSQLTSRSLCLAALPLRDGWLGLPPSEADVSCFVYLTSMVDMWLLQDHNPRNFAGVDLLWWGSLLLWTASHPSNASFILYSSHSTFSGGAVFCYLASCLST